MRLLHIDIETRSRSSPRDYKINGKKSPDNAAARWRLHLAPVFSGMRAAYITSQHLAKYVDQRHAEGAAGATVNRELAALKRMFRLGESTPKQVLHVPSSRFSRSTTSARPSSEDSQYERLVEGAELWFRTLVECGSTHRLASSGAHHTEGKTSGPRTPHPSAGAGHDQKRRRPRSTLTTCAVPLREICCGAGNSAAEIKKIGGWKTTAVFHRYAIIDRRTMTNDPQTGTVSPEQAAARAENEHSLSIVDPSEAKNAPPEKIQ